MDHIHEAPKNINNIIKSHEKRLESVEIPKLRKHKRTKSGEFKMMNSNRNLTTARSYKPQLTN